LKLVKSPRRVKDGFFLRVESYFNMARNIEEMDSHNDSRVNSPPVKTYYGGKIAPRTISRRILLCPL
jgi:predicted ATPase